MIPGIPLTADDETLDSFYHGRIRVLQKKKGYRFSVDAPLLADFIRTRGSDEILELGMGSGIISFLLSVKPFRRITGVEIQPALVDLARRNIRLNGLEGRINVLQADLRSFPTDRRFDVVFSNPPYIKKRTGHISDSMEKAIAKHEIKCDIFDIMQRTKELLKPSGHAYFIYPEKRSEEFVNAVEKNGLKSLTRRRVQSRADEKPNLFLASCGFSGQQEKELSPLIICDRDGTYTPEARKIFAGRADASSSG